MKEILGIMLVPMILFLVVVVPVWLKLHYGEKRRQSRELSTEEWTDFEATLENAEKLEQRVITLERILDDRDPNWREHL